MKALQEQITEFESSPSGFPESEGERRQATILFSDLSGYTAMNEKLDPEDVQKLMSRIKAEAIRIVERHDGIVNQFVGDEILALFGIPNAHEDDPIRAVKAALELHETVSEMSEEVESLIGRPLTMHSGIDTGLIVTAVWDDREGKFGVTGDTVNTGARLRAQAKGNEILISSRTQRLISPYFRTESLDPVNFKGKAEPMVPHRILGKTTIQTRLEAAEQRGFTPYTGRDEELATLHACLEKTDQGKGQFVTVVGEAGLGKSRLIYEFCKGLDRSKVTLLQGRCQSFGVSTPYLPFLDALKRGLGLRDEGSPGELHEKVVTNLTIVDSALEQYIPVILHVLSIPSDEYALPQELSGEKLKDAIQEAFVAFNTTHAKHLTTFLILEDWHWADEASNETLAKHLDVMASCSLMVVVLFRPEYSPKWKPLPFLTQIDLASVSEKSVESMIKTIYGVDRLPWKFASQVFQHSRGNPFFVEELCDLLVQEKTVLIEDGRLSLQQPIEKIHFPESVQAVIRAKLDRLGAEPKEVIRLASVIGKEFLKRILEKITTRKEDLSPSLDNLKQSDLIQQIGPLPEMIYQFYHGITQEVTYQTLLIEKRTLLHRLVAETIEIIYAERLEEQFEVLAHHYSKSGEKEKALHYLEVAGDKAARNFSLLDARSYYGEVMELIDAHLSTDQKKAAPQKLKRIEISLKWAKIAHYAAPEEYYSILQTSLGYANDLNDESNVAHLNYWLGQRHILLGKLEKAIEYFSHCIDLAERCNERALLAQAYAATGRVYFFEGDYLKANDCLEKSIPILIELDEQNDVAYAAGFLCGSYSLIGDFEKAFAYGDRAVKIADEIGNLSRAANSYMWLGIGYLIQGTWDKSTDACIESIRIAHSVGDVSPIISALVWLGYGLFMNGRKKEGLEKIQEGIEMMESSTFHIIYPMHYSYLAFCQAKAELMEKAENAASKSVEWTPKGMKGYESLASYALAMAESQTTGTDSAKVDHCFERGLSLCRTRGQRPFLAQGMYEYAKVLLQRGDERKGQELLNQAIELFTEMKMPWWLEQAIELKKSSG